MSKERWPNWSYPRRTRQERVHSTWCDGIVRLCREQDYKKDYDWIKEYDELEQNTQQPFKIEYHVEEKYITL